jgi:hypothetical protein
MRDFLRRPHNFFISYSRKDQEFAAALKSWLDRSGLRVWFDQVDLPSGEGVVKHIATMIGQSRGIIFLMSNDSIKSPYVQIELDLAITERITHADFQMILLRLDNCNIASHWKAVGHLKWHELATEAGPKLNLSAAADILCRTHAYAGWRGRQDELKEVYVSYGWRPGEDAFPDRICRLLAVYGLRLVGDLETRDQTDPQRIAGIMRQCWGHVFVLPRRSGAPEVAYKSFLREWNISESLGLARAVFAEPECALPPQLAEGALVVCPETLATEPPAIADPLRIKLDEFIESLVKPRSEAHAFFASEYEANVERNQLARAIVEATGTLPCYWGKDYEGRNVPGIIRDAIASAKFVVADLATSEPSTDGLSRRPRVNVNACIEAAIAWGADVRTHLLVAENPQAAEDPREGKTKHVPFMFGADQLRLYKDSTPSLAPGVDFLGAIHDAVLSERSAFGRRVINYEFGL